jgi:O-antigen ligase
MMSNDLRTHLLVAIAAVSVGLIAATSGMIAVTGIILIALLLVGIAFLRLPKAGQPNLLAERRGALMRNSVIAAIALSATPALSFHLVPLSNLIFATVAVLLFIQMISGAEFRALSRVEIRAMLLGAVFLTIGGLIATTGSDDPTAAARSAIRIGFSIGIPIICVCALIVTERHFKDALNAWIAMCAVSAAYAVFQWFTNSIFGLGQILNERPSGLTFHPNDVGSMAAIALVPVLVLAVNRHGWLRLLSFFTALVLIGGIIVSASLGGVIAASLALAIWAATAAASGRGLSSVAGIVTAFIMLAVLAPSLTGPIQDRIDKLNGAGTAATNSTIARVEGYEYALRQIPESPLIGEGMDSAGSLLPNGTRVQNVLLEPWYEAGLFGLMGAVILLVVPGVVSIDTYRNRSFASSTALATIPMLIYVAFVAIATEQLLYTKRIWWIPITLVVASRSFARDPKKSRTNAVSPLRKPSPRAQST